MWGPRPVGGPSGVGVGTARRPRLGLEASARRIRVKDAQPSMPGPAGMQAGAQVWCRSP